MERWQYMPIGPKTGGIGYSQETAVEAQQEWWKRLNELGAEGWEVLGPINLIDARFPSFPVTYLLIKRRVRDND